MPKGTVTNRQSIFATIVLLLCFAAQAQPPAAESGVPAAPGLKQSDLYEAILEQRNQELQSHLAIFEIFIGLAIGLTIFGTAFVFHRAENNHRKDWEAWKKLTERDLERADKDLKIGLGSLKEEISRLVIDVSQRHSTSESILNSSISSKIDQHYKSHTVPHLNAISREYIETAAGLSPLRWALTASILRNFSDELEDLFAAHGVGIGEDLGRLLRTSLHRIDLVQQLYSSSSNSIENALREYAFEPFPEVAPRISQLAAEFEAEPAIGQAAQAALVALKRLAIREHPATGSWQQQNT